MFGVRTTSAGMNRRAFLRASGAAGVLGAGGASGLTACGGSNGSSSSKELKFMGWGSSFESNAIKAMITRFNADHKGVTASATYVPYPTYETKISTLVASNSAPDVAYLDNVQVYQLAEQNRLVNLFPYFKKYPQLATAIPSAYMWYGKDKLAALQLAEGVQILWYNKKSFSAAGQSLPPGDVSSAWTWEEFVQAADKLTLDDNGKNPSEKGFNPKRIKQFGTTAPLNTGFMYGLMVGNGANYFDETGTKYTLDSPESVKVIQNMQDLIYKHRVAPTPAQLGNNAPTTAVQLQTQRIAMVVDGDWTLLDLGQSKLPYGCGVLPKYQKSVTSSGGAAGSVFASTKHLDEAMELYTYYNDPKHVALFKDGLWMPLQKDYYTDPAKISSWASGKIYPDNFKTAVIDPTLNNSVVWWAQSIKNSAKITNALTPAFDVIGEGKQDAKTVLTALKGKVQPLLQGRWPTQAL